MKPKVVVVLILITIIFYNYPATAQDRYDELFALAKTQATTGNYEEANLTFRKILTLNQAIPSEFCYFFAETLYHTGQYRNSKSFINKYRELAGENGQYAAEINRLNDSVEERLSEIAACPLCDDNGYVFEACSVCNGSGEVHKTCTYCKGKGNLACNLCAGEGVIVRKNVFNVNEYHTCSKCSGTGVIECRFCGGNKTVVSACELCDGLGKTASNVLCDHRNTSGSGVRETGGVIGDR